MEALPLGASTKEIAIHIIRHCHKADPLHSVTHQREDNTVSLISTRKAAESSREEQDYYWDNEYQGYRGGAPGYQGGRNEGRGGRGRGGRVYGRGRGR